MLKTIKNKILIAVAALTMAVPLILPIQAYASCSGNIANEVGSGADQAIGTAANTTCNTGSTLSSGVQSIAKKVVTLFSIVVGVISIVMIIYAGFRYIISGGESGSVTSAKNTLIFAIIGLIIVVLAQLIVHFVLSGANSVTSPTAPI